MCRTISLLLTLSFVLTGPVLLSDEVTIEVNGQVRVLQGRILVETQGDNGILFQTRDGRIWPLKAEQLKSTLRQEDEFRPLSRRELGKQIQSELNGEFRIHEADEFVVVYNTEKEYARWVAGLYRRFDRGFQAYWGRNRYKVQDPEFPLAVIIFRTRLEYEQYMLQELGVVSSEMIAYYNLETNRVAMFDLTAEQLGAGGSSDQRRITAVLNNPRAIPMVATIIHEGAHLLMFNNGMQTRFADTPLWINEGLAMYFEVPDLTASRGWRKIGEVNFLRFGQILQYFRDHPENSLAEMICSDQAFRGPDAVNMYAQAWAFNYFLLDQHREAYVDYLKFMSEKPRLIYDTAEQRLADFIRFFDLGLDELNAEFRTYVAALKK
jgi:hypothetical protein